MQIPKPPKQKKLPPDMRKEYLLEWKRLFEEISPNIKVFIKTDNGHDKNFQKAWEKMSDILMVLIYLMQKYLFAYTYRGICI